jgi:hypothetical protein
MLVTKGMAKGRPVPEREVSSHPPLLPAAAGGKREKGKALSTLEDMSLERLSHVGHVFD